MFGRRLKLPLAPLSPTIKLIYDDVTRNPQHWQLGSVRYLQRGRIAFVSDRDYALLVYDNAKVELNQTDEVHLRIAYQAWLKMHILDELAKVPPPATGASCVK
jgi:hypothetical protein